MASIRVRKDQDIDACAAVLATVHKLDGYPVEGLDDLQSWLLSGNTLQAWVAEHNGQIVGHAVVNKPGEGDEMAAAGREKHPSETFAILARFFVGPTARNRGVARQLVEAAVEWSRENGLRLVLEVLVKDQAAMRLYERLGWIQIRRTQFHFGDNQQMQSFYYVAPQT